MSVVSVVKILVVLAMVLAFQLTPMPTAIAQPISQPPEIHWTYDRESGPDHWAELDASFGTCANGKAQSPINLTGATSADLLNPEFHYQSVPLNLLNNGHTVQVPYAPGSYFVLEGDRYDLRQFHFHSPSEHAIDGQPQIAELHLVHQNEAGKLAVIAVMLKADDNSIRSDYQTLSNHLPNHAGDKIRTATTINAQSLLPTKTTTYRYSGSLTTPPCTESVTWLVMSEPVSLTTQELSKYEQLLNHNNRPLQGLNQRPIQIDTSL